MTVCLCAPCLTPAHGTPGYDHCADCCYGTLIEEYDAACPIPAHREMAARQFPATMNGPIFDWPLDKPVHEAVGEAVGAASACWSNLSGAGVFDSQRASLVVDELLDLLRRKLWTDE